MMDSSIVKLKTTLRGAGYSATAPRVAIFTALASYGPSGMATIAKAVSKEVDRATVYRTVDLFEKLGIVNRIWQGFKHQVELSEIFTPHHHHAVCQQCNSVLDIASPELEAALSALLKKHGFLAVSHSVEASGYCSRCQ